MWFYQSGSDSSDFITQFKTENNLERRKIMANKLRLMYSAKIPVILEWDLNSQGKKDHPFQKHKYLIPEEFTIGTLMVNINKNIMINANQNLFLFCDNTMLIGSHAMLDVYNKYKDEDGFLYIRCSFENTFG